MAGYPSAAGSFEQVSMGSVDRRLIEVLDHIVNNPRSYSIINTSAAAAREAYGESYSHLQNIAGGADVYHQSYQKLVKDLWENLSALRPNLEGFASDCKALMVGLMSNLDDDGVGKRLKFGLFVAYARAFIDKTSLVYRAMSSVSEIDNIPYNDEVLQSFLQLKQEPSDFPKGVTVEDVACCFDYIGEAFLDRLSRIADIPNDFERFSVQLSRVVNSSRNFFKTFDWYSNDVLHGPTLVNALTQLPDLKTNSEALRDAINARMQIIIGHYAQFIEKKLLNSLDLAFKAKNRDFDRSVIAFFSTYGRYYASYKNQNNPINRIMTSNLPEVRDALSKINTFVNEANKIYIEDLKIEAINELRRAASYEVFFSVLDSYKAQLADPKSIVFLVMSQEAAKAARDEIDACVAEEIKKYIPILRDAVIDQLKKAEQSPADFLDIFGEYVRAFKDEHSSVFKLMSRPEAKEARDAILEYVENDEHFIAQLDVLARPRGWKLTPSQRPLDDLIRDLREAYHGVEVPLSMDLNDFSELQQGRDDAGAGVVNSDDQVRGAPPSAAVPVDIVIPAQPARPASGLYADPTLDLNQLVHSDRVADRVEALGLVAKSHQERIRLSDSHLSEPEFLRLKESNYDLSAGPQLGGDASVDASQSAVAREDSFLVDVLRGVYSFKDRNLRSLYEADRGRSLADGNPGDNAERLKAFVVEKLGLPALFIDDYRNHGDHPSPLDIPQRVFSVVATEVLAPVLFSAGLNIAGNSGEVGGVAVHFQENSYRLKVVLPLSRLEFIPNPNRSDLLGKQIAVDCKLEYEVEYEPLQYRYRLIPSSLVVSGRDSEIFAEAIKAGQLSQKSVDDLFARGHFSKYERFSPMPIDRFFDEIGDQKADFFLLTEKLREQLSAVSVEAEGFVRAEEASSQAGNFDQAEDFAHKADSAGEKVKSIANLLSYINRFQGQALALIDDYKFKKYMGLLTLGDAKKFDQRIRIVFNDFIRDLPVVPQGQFKKEFIDHVVQPLCEQGLCDISNYLEYYAKDVEEVRDKVLDVLAQTKSVDQASRVWSNYLLQSQIKGSHIYNLMQKDPKARLLHDEINVAARKKVDALVANIPLGHRSRVKFSAATDSRSVGVNAHRRTISIMATLANLRDGMAWLLGRVARFFCGASVGVESQAQTGVASRAGVFHGFSPHPRVRGASVHHGSSGPNRRSSRSR